MERYVHDVSGHSDKISIEEALQNAEQIFTDLDGSTRSKVRNVKSIKAFASCANTRSDMGGDTLYYVINYNDEAGFAVMSANRNYGPVFAIGEEGNLEMNDTIDNVILAKFFQRLNGLGEIPTTRAGITIGGGITIPDTAYNALEIKEIMFPKVPKSVSVWLGDRGNPMYGKYPASTVSVAQAMSCFSHPETWYIYDNMYHPTKVVSTKNLNWALINSYELVSSSTSTELGFREIDKLFTLVDDSFNEYYDDAVYFACKNIRNIERFCQYDIHELYSPPMVGSDHYHEEPLSSSTEYWLQELKDGRIIVAGNFLSSFSEGIPSFTWVVDGYIIYGKSKPNALEQCGTDTMFHCVWGRGKHSNGYYALVDADWCYQPVTTPITMDGLNYTGVSPNLINENTCYSFKPLNR